MINIPYDTYNRLKEILEEIRSKAAPAGYDSGNSGILSQVNQAIRLVESLEWREDNES